MCILFMYCANRGGSNAETKWRLILAANRDENYERASRHAQFWVPDDPQILGGQDLVKGGTWLALATRKSLGNVRLRIGVLLNIREKQTIVECPARSRGMLIVNYLRGTESAKSYLDRIGGRSSGCAAFNLVLVEVLEDSVQVFARSSMSQETCTYDLNANEVLAFGNSPLASPLQKVTRGAQKFRAIVNEAHAARNTNRELNAALLQFLKSDEKYYPDAELIERTGSHSYALSSIFVRVPHTGFGTRTHTILSVNGRNEVEFVEETREHETHWNRTCFQFALTD